MPTTDARETTSATDATDATTPAREPRVGEKRARCDDDDVDADARGRRDATPTTRDGDDGADAREDAREDARANEVKPKDDAREDAAKATTSGFGSALANAGFGGFGGLKSAAASGGGFGAFAAASANAGTSGFASKATTPMFGGAVAAPVALFGAGKKKETTEEDEEGDDDPEREVANDSIKPVVELEVIETRTGEEGETCAFRTEGALFEYVNDAENGSRWVERGRGDVRLNEGENGSRLVMRAKGNFRLMLNAALFKGQKFQLMEGGKGVSFTCVNAASGADAKMSTFALKMRAAASNAQSQAENFHVAAKKAIEKLSEETKN
jgi:Ran-binding protein 3